MKFTDYVILNDETDSKRIELIVRVMNDGFTFGWYKSANSKRVISDSLFNLGTMSPNDAEEILRDRFNAYYIAEK